MLILHIFAEGFLGLLCLGADGSFLAVVLDYIGKTAAVFQKQRYAEK
jgi:hypothetical protein